MNVNAVGTAGLSAPTTTDNGLDRDAFLRLLLAQLANQDPLEPIKDQAFVAQLAQFSSLERLEEIADAVNILVTLTQSQQSSDKTPDSQSIGG